MAHFQVKQGKHYHGIPPLGTLPWIGQQAMARAVTFDASCAYDSAPYNSQDVNKLFGLSFGFGGVHHNSARFGWRYSMADKCIELLAYCYIEGQRNWDEQLRFPVVAQVQPGKPYLLEVDYDGDTYEFSVAGIKFPIGSGLWDEAFVVNAAKKLPAYGLTHGLYFGGALPAPHTMGVRIDRI
jgi:hypothetical protein